MIMERNMCSPTSPMPKGATGKWAHTNVEETLDLGETAWYRCKDCGHEWKEELPQ